VRRGVGGLDAVLELVGVEAPGAGVDPQGLNDALAVGVTGADRAARLGRPDRGCGPRRPLRLVAIPVTLAMAHLGRLLESVLGE
jgi:hypothetical protein